MKALLPAGFMPHFTADGQASIVICTLQGQETITLDQGNIPAPAKSSDQNSNTSFCPYAVLGFASDLIQPIEPSENIAYQYLSYLETRSTYAISVHVTSFYLSRAPPTFIL